MNAKKKVITIAVIAGCGVALGGVAASRINKKEDEVKTVQEIEYADLSQPPQPKVASQMDSVRFIFGAIS